MLVNAFISICKDHNVPSSMLHMSSKKEYVDKQFAWWTQLYKVGFLAHFECLLGEDYDDGNGVKNSESSIENAIFEDAYVALRSLDRVVFKISKIPLKKDGDDDDEEDDTEEDGTCIKITRLPLLPNNDNENNNGGIGKILIEIYFGKQFTYETLPQILLDGQLISTRTVIIAQQLNVTAVTSDAIKSANDEGFDKLIYYHSLRRRMMGPNIQTDEEIDELIITLESCRKKLIGLKDVSDIYTWLLVSERITRLFEGARITCCKDGKDLSIMGASLEMSVIMRDNHHVNMVESLANVFRMSGVNLLNLQNNSFQQQFYELPRENMPRLYRPPGHMTRSRGGNSLF